VEENFITTNQKSSGGGRGGSAIFFGEGKGAYNFFGGRQDIGMVDNTNRKKKKREDLHQPFLHWWGRKTEY